MEFNLKELRKDLFSKRADLNLEHDTAGAQMEISASTVAKLEQGGTPNLDTLMKVFTWLRKPPFSHPNVPAKYFVLNEKEQYYENERERTGLSSVKSPEPKPVAAETN